jgi:imidazolonepropionase-like amidohydrolase
MNLQQRINPNSDRKLVVTYIIYISISISKAMDMNMNMGVCQDCTATTGKLTGSRYLCLVVDRVLTCVDTGETPQVLVSSEGGNRIAVFVDSVEDKITLIKDYIVSVPELECPDAEIIVFPADTTLMPGFIDCHVHLTIAKDDYQIDHLRLSSGEKTLRALKAAQGLLRAGFTTLRSAGDADAFFPSFSLAKSIERKEFVGPRIVGAGHYISVTGGGGDINFMSPDNCPCCTADGVIANGREEMVKAVRNEVKYGSDWIKLLVGNRVA